MPPRNGSATEEALALRRSSSAKSERGALPQPLLQLDLGVAGDLLLQWPQLLRDQRGEIERVDAPTATLGPQPHDRALLRQHPGQRVPLWKRLRDHEEERPRRQAARERLQKRVEVPGRSDDLLRLRPGRELL